MPQADLLALYRRLFAATRALEARDRRARRGDARRATTADLTALPVGGDADPLRAGADRLPPSRPRRERDLDLGAGARATGARVLLRIEDHDRAALPTRVRRGPARGPRLARASAPDAGPVRQSDADALTAYDEALARLRAEGLVYGCDCTRATFAAWAAAHGRPGPGTGCPGGCRDASGLDGPVLRVALGGGCGALDGRARRSVPGEVAPTGDLPIRDRHGNWTYGFCVVVDDLRQGVDLVVRGGICSTRRRRRSGSAALLGRETPPTFAHHPLIRRPDGAKLSKSAGDTAVRELRAGRAVSRGRRCIATGLRAGDRLRRWLSRDRLIVRLERSSISQAWSSACQAMRRAA